MLRCGNTPDLTNSTVQRSCKYLQIFCLCIVSAENQVLPVIACWKWTCWMMLKLKRFSSQHCFAEGFLDLNFLVFDPVWQLSSTIHRFPTFEDVLLLQSTCMLIPQSSPRKDWHTHTDTNTHTQKQKQKQTRTHTHTDTGRQGSEHHWAFESLNQLDPLSRRHITQAMQLLLDMLVLPATCWLTSYIHAALLKEPTYFLCTSWSKRNTGRSGRQKQTSQKQSLVKSGSILVQRSQWNIHLDSYIYCVYIYIYLAGSEETVPTDGSALQESLFCLAFA